MSDYIHKESELLAKEAKRQYDIMINKGMEPYCIVIEEDIEKKLITGINDESQLTLMGLLLST